MEKDQLQNTDFNHIIGLISNAQNRAFKAVNKELVLLYWEIGSFVSAKVDSGAWGEGVVLKLADHIKSSYPNLKGFTKRGLYRMKQFYETYYQDEKVSPLVTQLSWSNHLMLLSKCKSIEEKQFYILLSVKEKLSFRELQRQIESGVFERTMLVKQNVSTVLTHFQNTVNQVFKDTYVFEFLDLPVNYNEQDLQNQLLVNLKKFLLELGGGFSFVGQEYRIQVGLNDLHLLFDQKQQEL